MLSKWRRKPKQKIIWSRKDVQKEKGKNIKPGKEPYGERPSFTEERERGKARNVRLRSLYMEGEVQEMRKEDFMLIPNRETHIKLIDSYIIVV